MSTPRNVKRKQIARRAEDLSSAISVSIVSVKPAHSSRLDFVPFQPSTLGDSAVTAGKCIAPMKTDALLFSVLQALPHRLYGLYHDLGELRILFGVYANYIHYRRIFDFQVLCTDVSNALYSYNSGMCPQYRWKS